MVLLACRRGNNSLLASESCHQAGFTHLALLPATLPGSAALSSGGSVSSKSTPHSLHLVKRGEIRNGKQGRTSRGAHFFGWDELKENVFTKTCASSLSRGSKTTSASDITSPLPKGLSVFVTSRARK